MSEKLKITFKESDENPIHKIIQKWMEEIKKKRELYSNSIENSAYLKNVLHNIGFKNIKKNKNGSFDATYKNFRYFNLYIESELPINPSSGTVTFRYNCCEDEINVR